MNPFVVELESEQISQTPDKESRKLVLEDNIGESVHLHYRNLRLEFTSEGFEKFSKNISEALKKLE